MANIVVEIRQEEKDQLLKSIRKFQDKVMSVTKFANDAGMNPNRARFVMDELLADGTVDREAVKNFNPHYRRYIYKVVK